MVLEADRLVAVLEQEVELSEHLGDLAAVDLVDDEEVLVVRIILRFLRRFEQWAVPELESRLPVLHLGWAEAPYEVLVGVGGVELDESDALR